jgi:hypothetical protein
LYPFLIVNSWDSKWGVREHRHTSTTYNLTELKGIKFVSYNMQAGDHVSPGTYSRKSFENYR